MLGGTMKRFYQTGNYYHLQFPVVYKQEITINSDKRRVTPSTVPWFVGGGGTAAVLALGWWVLTRCVACRHEMPRIYVKSSSDLATVKVLKITDEITLEQILQLAAQKLTTSTYILQGVEQLFLELQRNKEYADVDECVCRRALAVVAL